MENEKKKDVQTQNDAKIEEVKPKKRKRNKKYLLFFAAGFAFIIYAAFTLISQSIEINQKRQERDKLQEQKEIVVIDNEDLEKMENLSGDELKEYIEDKARKEYDYIKPGERVFYNISGD